MFISSPSMFADLVRANRIGQGLTQAELAARSGMSHRWVQRLEAGELTPTLTAMIAVLGVLGYELSVEQHSAGDDFIGQIFQEIS